MKVKGLRHMKLRSTILIAFAVVAPLMTGLTLHQGSQASFANEFEGTEFSRRRGQRLSPEEREAKRAEKLAKLQEFLELSDTQVSQIEAIREQYQPQREALKAEAMSLRENGDREGLRELRGQFRSLRQEMKDEISEILTDEQRQKFETLKAQRRGGRRFR